MTSETDRPRWVRIFSPLVWLTIVQVLVLSVMASSAEMHEHLHEGSHDTDHHCLCTDLGSGTIGLTPIAPVVAPGCTVVQIKPVPVVGVERQWLPAHLCGSLLEHGPPVVA